MVARILAFLAAVAMVVGAVLVRDRIDDDTERRTTTLRLVCSTELAAVCDALAQEPRTKVITTVEPAAETADQLTNLEQGERSPLDGWLVTAPWPIIVAEARARAGLERTVSAGRVLARSPVVLAVREDRRKVLTAHCKAEPGWKCLGDVAGTTWTQFAGGEVHWGRVKPGHPPVSTAAGLTVVGAATVSYFDERVELSSADLKDEGYLTWLDRIERAVPTRPASPFQTMLLRPAFDVAGTLEAEAGPLLARSERSDKPVLLYPSPVTTADVVLGTTSSREGRLLSDLVSGGGRDALAVSGWRVEGKAAVAGVRTDLELPPTSNLPEPGVLDALRAIVEQASR